MVYDKLESLSLAGCRGCRDIEIMKTKKIAAAAAATTIKTSTTNNNHIYKNISSSGNGNTCKI
jgi:hypothetical protein